MKSDLTCPVEITKVTVKRETDSTKEKEQIVCLIEFFNLSEKVIDSLQMNIICFDEEGTRLGGRLVRAAAQGEGRAHFSGTFMPERVNGAVRVNAAVEKVWFKDGVIWRREERNVREYTPNALPEGRELDRLRDVAGADAAGYAREDDIVWMCVCGRANPTSDDRCWRCERERAQVLRDYSFAAIDSTAGQKERDLQAQTKDTLRRSSEETIKEQSEKRRESRKRRRRVKSVIWLLVLVAFVLAMARWGIPYGADWYADYLMEEGKLSDAKEIYLLIEEYWPGMLDAAVRADEAEEKIIEGLIVAGRDEQLREAEKRAATLNTDRAAELHDRAVIDRAALMRSAGDMDGAEELLGSLPENEEAVRLLNELIYDIAMDAREKVNYPVAIERFESLGDYADARSQKEECIYDYGRQLMREGEYQLAHAQLMLVSGLRDAVSLIRECRYEIALDEQENGDYIAAAKDFESLGVYEEAETRAKQCRYTAGMNALEAGELELAAEQLLAAQDYEDAQARYAETAKTIGLAALEKGEYDKAIEYLETIEADEETAQALNAARYAAAQQLEARGSREEAALAYGALGDYEDARGRMQALEYGMACDEMETSPETALDRFEGLGSYQDAQEKADECRYLLAKQRYDASEFEDAAARFDMLGDYEDAKTQARRSRYAYAGVLMGEDEYTQAAEQYALCGAYLDSEDRAMQAKYAEANALYEAGEYAGAAQSFARLGSYEDAKLRVEASEDAWLKQPMRSAKMDMELGDYASVIEALEPLWTLELPERYAQIPEMFAEASLARADELIEQGKPLDAYPLLLAIEEVSKAAGKRLEAYVYGVIGRWKDKNGVEYMFRADGSCSVAGEEMYFGGRDYEITMGSEPYPTEGAYSVVNLRSAVLTLKNLETKDNIRLTYVGEPTDRPETAEADAEADPDADTAEETAVEAKEETEGAEESEGEENASEATGS